VNERLMRANSDGKYHVIFIPKYRLRVCFFPAQAGDFLILFVTLAQTLVLTSQSSPMLTIWCPLL
jgi:REP element-mobilizing transposase RayT